MSSISLRLGHDGATVEIELVDLTTAQRSEIEYQLGLSGAIRHAQGMSVDSFAFCRASPQIAPLLRRTGADVSWDTGVETLLVRQLNEIRARRAAAAAQPLQPGEVEALVRATGRFARSLTDRQQANLG